MAEELLDRLIKEAGVNDVCVANATMYNECMNAWRQSGDASRVEDLFSKMQRLHEQDPSHNPAPDTVTYNTILHTWALNKEDHATRKAEEWIRIMEEDDSITPNTRSYNLLMLAYANRVGEYGSAKWAEDTLLKLSRLGMEGGPSPDKHSYNLVLKAWKNSGDDKGPDRALEILRLLIKLSKDGHDVHPDEVSFLTVIDSFAKQGRALQAQEVLYLSKEVDLPDATNLTRCFNAVINAWAKSGAKDAGLMAEAVLESAIMQSKTSSNVIVRPNIISYTSCLDAHVKSDTPYALENAETFFRDMIQSFQSGQSNVAPDAFAFTCIINAFARSKREDAARKSGILAHTNEGFTVERQSFQMPSG